MRSTMITPLFPAGHLPHKGGDQLNFYLRPFFQFPQYAAKGGAPISLLVREMPGRAEGGYLHSGVRA